MIQPLSFTAAAEQALHTAQAEAAHYRQPRIGTEHLLLALIQTADTPAARILAGFGFAIPEVRAAIDLVAGYGGPKQTDPARDSLSQRMQDVLKRAERYARAFDTPQVDTIHLLLALTDVPGSAALSVLQTLGVERDDLRALTLTVLQPVGSAGSQLTHLNAQGEAHMVDVGAKADTAREAIARGVVQMQPHTLAAIVAGDLPKGDVLATARIAGIMAAKRTSDLIPLCHPLQLTHVGVMLTPDAAQARLLIEAVVRTSGKTGVEMEALTAVAVAALTIYDMCKAIDRGMRISDVRLAEKRGGKSGELVLE